MFNKKYLTAGVVALAVIAGLIFFRHNPSVPNSSNDPSAPTTKSSVSESGGIKELTKEIAGAAILERIKVDKVFDRMSPPACPGEGGLQSSGIGSINSASIEALEKLGFVKIVTKNFFGEYVFTVTEQAKPYFEETQSPCKRFIIGRPDRVEVTDLVEAGIEKTEKTMYAKATVKYAPTPAGELINKVEASRDQQIQRNFVFRSGSWILE